MKNCNLVSRRSFLALAASAPFATAASKGKKIPVALQVYSVKDELSKDFNGTIRAVAKMGYEGVEFFAPYFKWTPTYAKEVRKLLNDLGIPCYSTHNQIASFTPEGLPHALEINQIIGSKYLILATMEPVQGLDGWKKLADGLNQAVEKGKLMGVGAGQHTHVRNFQLLEGKRPIDVVVANTSNDVMIQLDVGTCLDAGADPIAWIKQAPGRTTSIHCKDWSSDKSKGYRVLFGEGIAPWKDIFVTADAVGGLKYLVIEQEPTDHPPMEAAELSLANFRKLRA